MLLHTVNSAKHVVNRERRSVIFGADNLAIFPPIFGFSESVIAGQNQKYCVNVTVLSTSSKNNERKVDSLKPLHSIIYR